MAAVKWHVLGDQVTQSTTLGPGGSGVIDVYEVPYLIDDGPAMGHRGSVSVPASQFNQVTVAEAINQQVGAVHTVAGLTS